MNHVKPRNGPISPRERDMNSSYSNHQPPHYNNYNNNSSVSPNNQQHQPQQPNSDLINFVQGAWKEKVSESASYQSRFNIFPTFRCPRKSSNRKTQTSSTTLISMDGFGHDNTKTNPTLKVFLDESSSSDEWRKKFFFNCKDFS